MRAALDGGKLASAPQHLQTEIVEHHKAAEGPHQWRHGRNGDFLELKEANLKTLEGAGR